MTREEAIKLIGGMKSDLSDFYDDNDLTALDMAISALSENNALDKISAEIDEKISHYEHFLSSNTANGLMIAKKIINKYRIESEENNNV